MKNIAALFIIPVLFLFCQNQTSAQNWSKAQLEVWQNVEDLWKANKNKDLDKFMSFFHEDFMGWAMTSPYPLSKQQVKDLIGHYLPKNELVLYNLRPMTILIKGNTAIVHYYYSQVQRDKQGHETSEKGRWSETYLKEGNKWLLLGDAGGAISD